MAAEHPNAQIFRDLLAALEKRDLEAMRSYLAPDIVWHMVGSEDPIRGRDALIETLTSDLGDIEFDSDLHDVLANDEHVVGLVTAHLRRGDDEVTYRATEIAHMRDGKVTERWAMVDDFQAMADFWAG